jgi:UDP-N-acetyl-D-glucosamine dehydrogenase
MQNKTVCVMGLGFVGSAMSIAIAAANNSNNKPIYKVVGLDLPTKEGLYRVNSIRKNQFPFKTEDKKINSYLKKIKLNKNLGATYDPEILQEADIIVVDIHLDVSFTTSTPKINLKPFMVAIKLIGQKAKKNSLIIVETTVPPGTCQNIIYPCLLEEFKRRNIDTKFLNLAHSYERVMPGKNYLSSITNFWRVYSGINKKSADMCKKFLETIINTKDYPLKKLDSTTASEIAKVLENTYRAVNIAFIDEWTKFSEKVHVDLFEILDAIRVRPTHNNIRFPGLGVGGYCLTKDPKFTPAASKLFFNLNSKFPFSNLAVKINNEMPLHVIDIIKENYSKNLKKAKILILGASYREDVGDSRYSPSMILLNSLRKLGADISYHDPYVDFWEEAKSYSIKSISNIKNYDIVIFTVAHRLYRNRPFLNLKKNSLLVDANNVLSKVQRNKYTSIGINIFSVGRGKGL